MPAKQWSISEQIVEDPASGLTFQFEVAPDGERVLRVFGDMPFGNRQINFSRTGELVGTGTSVQGVCKPSWLTEVDT